MKPTQTIPLAQLLKVEQTLELGSSSLLQHHWYGSGCFGMGAEILASCLPCTVPPVRVYDASRTKGEKPVPLLLSQDLIQKHTGVLAS